MHLAVLDSDTCDRQPGCPAARACPRGAVVRAGGAASPRGAVWAVDESRCTGCGACVGVCPMGAVAMNLVVRS